MAWSSPLFKTSVMISSLSRLGASCDKSYEAKHGCKNWGRAMGIFYSFDRQPANCRYLNIVKLLKDLDVAGKRVFVRADLDVPIENSKLEEAEQATRLTNLAPTVEWLIEHGARQIFIAGHIDRPLKPAPSLSTRILEEPLEQILKRSVTYKGNFDTGDGMLSSMAQLILFENLRFWGGEEANDPDFARQLATPADVYVNEAFGNCHRAHASMVGVPAILPHAAGLHLEEEVNQLTELTRNPERPLVAIVGGVKIETKMPVVANLAKVADVVLVGGEIARELTTDKSNVIVASLTPDTKDIDQDSINKFKSIIKTAKTIVWNGPMGIFEEGFEAGSAAVAWAIIDSGAYSVVGGGETTQFLVSKNLLSRFSFVSSGGGAMLEFLAGRDLPGIAALE